MVSNFPQFITNQNQHTATIIHSDKVKNIYKSYEDCSLHHTIGFEIKCNGCPMFDISYGIMFTQTNKISTLTADPFRPTLNYALQQNKYANHKFQ